MKGLQAILHQVESKYVKAKRSDFKPGDLVRVQLKVKEGEKERLQSYEGVVIARQKGGSRETFRVRRISYGVGVERSFLLHSPFIIKIEISKRGMTRRAKLFHLRGKSSKDARIVEQRATDATGLTVDTAESVAPAQPSTAPDAEAAAPDGSKHG